MCLPDPSYLFDVLTQTAFDPIPMVIACNKADMESSLTLEEIQPLMEAELYVARSPRAACIYLTC